MNYDFDLLEQYCTGMYNSGKTELEILLMAQAIIAAQIVKALTK